MLLHIYVRNDVMVLEGVLARPEVPRFLLGVVIPLLQSFQLVVEVDHVVGLLVPQGGVFVLGKHIDHVLLLGLFNRLLGLSVRVGLRDRIVERLLLFDELSGDFFVGGLFPLEVLLLVEVVVHVGLPFRVAWRQVVGR